MSDSPPAMPVPSTPPRQGMSGCLKFFLILSALIVVSVVLFAASVWRAVSWLDHSLQDAPVIAQPLELSPGEKEDVERILYGIHESRQTGTPYEDFISVTVLNGALDRILEEERKKGKETPRGIRVSLEGEKAYLVKLSALAPKETPLGSSQPPAAPAAARYMNITGVFEFEVTDAKLRRLACLRLAIGGNDAPWLARLVIETHLDKVRKELESATPEKNPLALFKTFQREGERIHVVIDGTKIKD